MEGRVGQEGYQEHVTSLSFEKFKAPREAATRHYNNGLDFKPPGGQKVPPATNVAGPAYVGRRN